MKRILKAFAGIMVFFSSVGICSQICRKKKYKIQIINASLISDVKRTLKGYDVFKNDSSNRIQKAHLLKACYNTGDSETSFYERLKDFSRLLFYKIPELDYFKDELLNYNTNVSETQNGTESSCSFVPIMEEAGEDSVGDIVQIDINEDYAFEYAKSLLMGENNNEVGQFVDSLEFRDFCLHQKFNFDDLENDDYYQEICQNNLESYYLSVAEINNLIGYSYLEDPSDWTSGNSEHSNESGMLNQEHLSILPSEVMTIDQLNLLFTPEAVECICSSMGITIAGCSAISLPFGGRAIAAILFALAIIVLLLCANEIIPLLEYVIGFFVNCFKKFVSFLSSFFASFLNYTQDNTLDIALEKYTEDLYLHNISPDYAKNAVINSVYCNGIPISIDSLPDDLIVPLGISGVYDSIARENGYPYYYNANYNNDLVNYSYDGVWIINAIFINVMVLKKAKFLLCSRPSLYYDKISGLEIGGPRAYSKELKMIHRECRYNWAEPIGDPYIPCLAKRIDYYFN